MRKKYTPTTLVTELIMAVVCIVFLIPIYYLFVSTFKTQQEIVEAPLALPSSLNLTNYARALQSMDFFRHFFNSLLITSVVRGFDRRVGFDGGLYYRAAP